MQTNDILRPAYYTLYIQFCFSSLSISSYTSFQFRVARSGNSYHRSYRQSLSMFFIDFHRHIDTYCTVFRLDKDKEPFHLYPPDSIYTDTETLAIQPAVNGEISPLLLVPSVNKIITLISLYCLSGGLQHLQSHTNSCTILIRPHLIL